MCMYNQYKVNDVSGIQIVVVTRHQIKFNYCIHTSQCDTCFSYVHHGWYVMFLAFLYLTLLLMLNCITQTHTQSEIPVVSEIHLCSTMV